MSPSHGLLADEHAAACECVCVCVCVSACERAWRIHFPTSMWPPTCETRSVSITCSSSPILTLTFTLAGLPIDMTRSTCKGMGGGAT